MGKAVVSLREEDLLELQAILLDEDQERALAFLQSRIAPQLPRSGTRGCDSTRINPYLVRAAAKRGVDKED